MAILHAAPKNRSYMFSLLFVNVLILLFLFSVYPKETFANYNCIPYVSCSTSCAQQYCNMTTGCRLVSLGCPDPCTPEYYSCDKTLCDNNYPFCSASQYVLCEDKFVAYETQCENILTAGDNDCFSSYQAGQKTTNLLDYVSYICNVIGYLNGGYAFALASDITSILSSQGKSTVGFNSLDSCTTGVNDIFYACEIASFNERAQCTINTNATISVVTNILVQ